jgi:hypothetical protein
MIKNGDYLKRQKGTFKMQEKLMMDPLGFELVSIEPESPNPINWKDFKRYLDN